MITLEEVSSYTFGEISHTLKEMEIAVGEGRTLLSDGCHGEKPLSLFLDVRLKTLEGRNRCQELRKSW